MTSHVCPPLSPCLSCFEVFLSETVLRDDDCVCGHHWRSHAAGMKSAWRGGCGVEGCACEQFFRADDEDVQIDAALERTLCEVAEEARLAADDYACDPSNRWRF